MLYKYNRERERNKGRERELKKIAENDRVQRALEYIQGLKEDCQKNALCWK